VQNSPSAPIEPPRTTWQILKSIGPGLILTANIVGTGELIMTTRLGSEVGFTLLWFIIFSCFIKVFVQVELGRYALAEGKGSLQMLNSLPGPRMKVRWILWIWIFMYFGSLCQMSGMVAGCAEIFSSKANLWAHRGWAVGIAVLTGTLLALGRYGFIEKTSTVMVALFTISNLVAVGFLQGTEFRMTAADAAHGLSFRLPRDAQGHLDILTAFGVFGITGVGASELIFYPVWCLEKGYARAAGPREDTPEWYARAHGWLRVMKYDAWLSMVVYTLGTLSFYILGAAILNRQGQTVGNQNPMQTLSLIYTRTMGDPGRWIFAVGGFMVLYSTLFVSSASNSRLGVDFLGLLGVLKPRDPEHRMRFVRVAVVIVPLYVMSVYLLFGNPVTLVTIGAVLQGVMLPFLGFAAVYFHHRRIPEGLRPGRPWTLFLWLSFLAIGAVGVYQARSEIGKLIQRITS
jgi:Mn2+/Fe2+ NRAMP family transporter